MQYDVGGQCLAGCGGKVCDEEEEVKQVHLLPLQGKRCRGFAPAGEDCLHTLPLQVYHKYKYKCKYKQIQIQVKIQVPLQGRTLPPNSPPLHHTDLGSEVRTIEMT